MNDAHCGACSSGCKICTSATACSSCLQRYYLSGTSCTPCGSNCLTCNAAGCLECDSLSTLISGVCYLCTDPTKSGTAGC